MRTPKRVLFVGWGRAGKDEACQFAEAHLGLRYGGSLSWHAKEDMARLLGVHPMTAWEQRHQNRQFWKDECDKLRRHDPGLLSRRALQTGDIVAGLRDRVELLAVVQEDLFDEIVWVQRLNGSYDSTVTYTADDVINAGGRRIFNSGSLEEYHLALIYLFNDLQCPIKLDGYATDLLTRQSKGELKV